MVLFSFIFIDFEWTNILCRSSSLSSVGKSLTEPLLFFKYALKYREKEKVGWQYLRVKNERVIFLCGMSKEDREYYQKYFRQGVLLYMILFGTLLRLGKYHVFECNILISSDWFYIQNFENILKVQFILTGFSLTVRQSRRRLESSDRTTCSEQVIHYFSHQRRMSCSLNWEVEKANEIQCNMYITPEICEWRLMICRFNTEMLLKVTSVEEMG